jgi:mRNA interferase MazF
MRRGDVYWVKFKEPDKRRPALILTRDSAIPLLNRITIIPTTSTLRDNPSTVWLDEADGMIGSCLLNIDQIQTLSKEKFGAYLTHLGEDKMNEVFETIIFAFGYKD